ncbi:AbrB/MazE/SpoVT family DNA-binding domain-containing protein [Candidatus Korarchaeum cryptofilum]|uniref:Transcriptional regulator, AbrB family n=1 Tax=Korarchaeum cryptofilum (strain OPF8) TaxID=374847 RepID=B1L572_KORCO|nr:AbrB/MazE/SpoVT family DNA-binding domain-containing protein [Candidatus Korarchaeum cryptofilum]ACB07601.1 transcriptional regulator, AbrB family [Candidatus Korarchaeum cryptofilum OPF8]
MQREVVKVRRRTSSIPKGIRDALGIRDGTLLEVRVEEGRIILEPLDLWDKVWRCCTGSAEEELDKEEEAFWRRRAKL